LVIALILAGGSKPEKKAYSILYYNKAADNLLSAALFFPIHPIKTNSAAAAIHMARPKVM